MVPAKQEAARNVVAPQSATLLHSCYARVFGHPDATAIAELDAIAPYFPSHPSPELLLLVAASVHHRASERAVSDALASQQAHLQVQIATFAAAIAQVERIRELRMGILRLLVVVLLLAGSVYLAVGALHERQNVLLAILQCGVAILVSAAALCMVWRPR